MFRSIHEFETTANPKPTAAETALIAACRKGEKCVVNGGEVPDEGNTDKAIQVRADLLALLILGGTQECGLHEQGVWLEGAHIVRELNLNFMRIRGRTVLHCCRFGEEPQMLQTCLPLLILDQCHLPGIFAQGIKVDGSFFLRGIRSKGTVDVNNAEICGQLEFDDSELEGLGQAALDAQGTRVLGGFNFRNVTILNGHLDLGSAAVSRLVDDIASWANCKGKLILDGFKYDQIAGHLAPKTYAARRNWLEKGSRFSNEFRPQPYTRLAKVFRAAGHNSESRKVLLARDTILFDEAAKADRKSLDIALNGDQTQRADAGMIWLRLYCRRLWAGLSRRVVGHGHRPEYALFWALAFTCFGTILYFIASRNGLMVPNSAVVMVSQDWLNAVNLNKTAPTDLWNTTPSAAHYETFMAAIYAVDVFLPIVDLGQEGAWAATTTTTWGCFLRVITFAYQVAGWVVTSLGIAAITGFVQRGSPD